MTISASFASLSRGDHLLGHGPLNMRDIGRPVVGLYGNVVLVLPFGNGCCHLVEEFLREFLSVHPKPLAWAGNELIPPQA